MHSLTSFGAVRCGMGARNFTQHFPTRKKKQPAVIPSHLCEVTVHAAVIDDAPVIQHVHALSLPKKKDPDPPAFIIWMISRTSFFLIPPRSLVFCAQFPVCSPIPTRLVRTPAHISTPDSPHIVTTHFEFRPQEDQGFFRDFAGNLVQKVVVKGKWQSFVCLLGSSYILV